MEKLILKFLHVCKKVLHYEPGKDRRLRTLQKSTTFCGPPQLDHNARCTCRPICNRLTNEQRQIMDGEFVVPWCTTDDLTQTDQFVDELQSQVDNFY